MSIWMTINPSDIGVTDGEVISLASPAQEHLIGDMAGLGCHRVTCL